jgi:threonine dehydratase
MTAVSSEDFQPAIQLVDVQRAAECIRPHIVKTPLVPSESLSNRFSCQLSFKAENLQHVGAFKARGATNAVMSLDADAADRGVITHSSGNHAAALARAAALRGIPAYVVMPTNSSPRKMNAVRGYGIEPHLCEPTTEAREQAAEQLRQQTGATLIHPYDNAAVMAGQGTVGLEILEQCEDLDAILVPVGGGGLLSGILATVKTLHPEVTVIACEPAWADDTARSLMSGHRQMPTRYDSIADGLRTAVGVQTFPIIQQLLDEILLVEEDQIRRAMRVLVEEAHLVAEPSGAITLAAVAQYPKRFRNLSVVAVISGGNLDLGSCQIGQSAKPT